jgi:NitT/TauT family transport system substrate-binding protein
MMKVSRRSVLTSAAGALAAPHLSFGQAVAPKVRFAVDFVWQSNHSIWTLAEDSGVFAAEKLNVNVDRGYGSSDNLAKLGTGALDIGLVDPNLLAKFNQENPSNHMTAVFIVYDAAPSAAVFLRSSGIKTMKDMEGRKVAVTDGSANVPLFKVLCQINGVDPNKIEFVSVSPQLRDTMVIQKRVDIAVGFFTTSFINMVAAGVAPEDVGYFQYNKHGLALYSLSLVCKKDYCAANPETVAAFVRATIKGARAMLADPKAAIGSILRRDGLLKESVELARNELMNEGCLLTPWVRERGISTVDKERFERTTGQVAELLGVTTKPKMEDIYTDRFLPAQVERSIV